MYGNSDVNDGGANEYLTVARWPRPLQESFLKSVSTQFTLRYFIVDDSGSMAIDDGSRILKINNFYK